MNHKNFKEMLEQKVFWKQLIVKTFIMFGFTYFSVAVALGSWTLITPAILSSCLYFFVELMKYYKLEPSAKVLSKTKQYMFLI